MKTILAALFAVMVGVTFVGYGFAADTTTKEETKTELKSKSNGTKVEKKSKKSRKTKNGEVKEESKTTEKKEEKK